jgi:diaminohydroxyphosphoribosylaminopyrimidine deaminase / 5-amino-6-(5-phosphoribosylamino)uracil reductase
VARTRRSAAHTASSDERFMARAIRLARAGLGSTYPNPSVGAVVVRRGRVVGAARSDPTGGPHAEVKALVQAGAAARGATLYVTLEPCCHVGRTGPCTHAILESGLARVAVGMRDPAPHADGKGIRRLAARGVAVTEGVLGEACAELHAHYVHHVATGRPWVTLKVASTLDGRIATADGDSRWITSERARRYGHRLRAQHHAIAVGVGTVLVDDPRLDVRLVKGVDPVPVVFDSRLRVAGARPMPQVIRHGTIVLHVPGVSSRARAAVERTDAELVEVEATHDGRVDIGAALRILGRREIRSLLVEGGGLLHGSFVGAALWKRMYLFQAPKLLGDGRSMIAGVVCSEVGGAPRVRVVNRQRVGDDLLTILEPG